MKHITIQKEKCCGCGACAAVCGKKAITLQEDADGIWYPSVDEEKCIQCSLCLKACAYTAPKGSNVPLEAYGAKVKDCEVHKRSASGGVFAAIARRSMETGYAAGAVMELGSDPAIFHMVSNSPDDIPRMQGSKYVQSHADTCYPEIKRLLREGKQVVFSGTPCQVDAVKRITGSPENLLTVDLVCHGVPSQKLFLECLDGFGKLLHRPIRDFVFRDKSTAKDWRCSLTAGAGGKRKVLSARFVSYYHYFLTGASYRENCYSCPYANLHRASDLTIGDYWGIENHHASETGESSKGWSAVLVNTEKGKQLLTCCAEDLLLIPTKTEWIQEQNKQLNHPSRKSPERQVFLDSYRKGGYPEIEKQFRKQNGGQLRFCYRLLKDIYKNSKAHI